MTDKQIEAGLDFAIGWLEKLSIGCLLVGMFQPSHMFGGIIGGLICGLFACSLKIWRAR